jgi:8-oxo-dGTP pyrophosphatase MutT (NUDIX family)
MPTHPPYAPGDDVLRHFTVAVFVVHAGRVLLHYHAKLGKWLPPGGHIEDNELPDDAAVREVLEETGLRVQLMGGRGLGVDAPRQLVIPAGIQVEDIYPGHQHVDLVYFARPGGGAAIATEFTDRDRVGWYCPSDLAGLGASDEIQRWAQRAVADAAKW